MASGSLAISRGLQERPGRLSKAGCVAVEKTTEQRYWVHSSLTVRSVASSRCGGSDCASSNTGRVPTLTDITDSFVSVAVDLQQVGNNLLVILDVLIDYR